MHQRRRRDEGIGHAHATLSKQPRSFGDATVNDQLLHADEKSANGGLATGATGEQLGPGDDGVAEAAAPWKALDAFEMIDADVRVDEQFSHDPTRRGSAPWPGVRRWRRR